MTRFVTCAIVALCQMGFSLAPSATAWQPIAPRPVTDVHGDPLPEGARSRIGTIRLRHASSVSSLAFSPDGQRISAATIWFDVGVWDARTGQGLSFRSSRQEEGLFRAAVSPDGSLFAGRLENGDLGVQRASDGKIVRRFAGKMEMGLVFSRDNCWLAAADREGNTSLWDLEAGKQAHQFKTKPWDTFDDFCHAFTPDGTTFIQARADGITFWNVQSGKEIRRIESKPKEEFLNREWPGDLAVSPSGELLAVRIAYGRVDLWEIKTGRKLRELADQRNEVGPVFSPDGKQIVTSGREGEIRFGEVESGKLARTLTAEEEVQPTSFAFSPNGKLLASGGSDHAIHIWDLDSGKNVSPGPQLRGGTPSVRFLADGKTLLVNSQYDTIRKSTTIDERLSYWDLQGKLLRQARLAPGESHALALTGNAQTIAYGAGPNFGPGFRPTPNRFLKSSLRLCDVALGKQHVKEDVLPCQIHDLMFSPDDRYLLIRAFNAGPNPDDYHHLDTLQLWKRATPTRLEKVADLPMLYFLSGFAVSPDSRWVVVTSELGCRFHECETGKLIRSHADAPGSIVAVSPSGRMLVSRDAKDARVGQTVVVWEQATGKTICELECESGQTNWAPLVVSPDGKFIAGCLNREVICLWDVFTGKQLTRLAGHRGDINSLCFSADGQSLVSASADTTILVWDWKSKLPKDPDGAKLSPMRVEQLGKDLQARDTRRAYAAIAALLNSPNQAIDLLRKTSLANSALEPLNLKPWIADLDNDDMQVRERASQNLIESGELAEAALREAVTAPASLEARSRINRVLEMLPRAAPHATTLATIRTLELLELIGTPDARKLVEEFSRQTGDLVRQREAERTLKRLNH